MNESVESSRAADNKRIAKNTLFLYGRMIFTMLLGLYTSRVILQTLGVVDYGIYEVVGGVVAMFTFLNGTMAAATQRYMTYEIGKGDQNRLHRVFCVSLNIHIIICVIVVLLAETVGLWFLNSKLNIPEERLSAARAVFQFSVLTTVMSITQAPYNALIVAHEKMSVYAYVGIFSAIIKLLLVLLVGIIAYDKLFLFGIFIFLKELIVLLYYRVYCIKKFPESSFSFIWDKPLLKEIGGFAGWNLSGHLVNMAKTQGVSMLLNVFHGPVCNAARGIANQVQGVLLQFSDNFQMAAVPQITKRYAVGDLNGMNSLIIKSSKISLILLSLVMTPFIIEADTVLGIWLTEVPEHCIVFTRLCLIATLCNALSGVLVYGALATGDVKKYQIIMSSIIGLQFVLVWIAYALGYTPEVMYVSEILCYIMALMARLLLLRKMVNFPVWCYLKEVVLRCTIAVAVSLIIPCYFHGCIQNNIIRLVIVFGTSVILISTSSFALALTKDERVLILQSIKSKMDTILRK